MSVRLQQVLTSDGALLLDVDAHLEGLLAPWVALRPALPPEDQGRVQGRIYVHEAPLLGVEVPRIPPTLRVGSVGVWLRPEAGRAALGASEEDCAGAVDLDVLQATIVTGTAPAVAGRLRGMVGLAVAMLLARMGRALVCAAGVVPPGGGGWLVVGDEGAGKTTAVLRLAAAGWPYLAVERSILKQNGGGGLVVEGWPEPASVEAEYASSTRAASAVLDGVLLVRMAPGGESVLRPRSDLDLLAALSPTSPWLRLDASGASGVVRTLRFGVRRPVYELHIGLDAYASPERLVEVLGTLPGVAGR